VRLKNKVIVVTGAALGMGQAMARLFAKEGAQVIAGDKNVTALEQTTTGIKEAGGTVTGVRCDISVRADAEALVNTAHSQHGKLDGLVNNAGIIDRLQPVGTLDDEVWNRVLGVNLNGAMYASRRAVQLMLESKGGSIVNISSFAGTSGAMSGAAYAASKHALLGLTRSTAWMYMNQGIRCNAILPGGVETSMGATLAPDKLDSFALSRITPAMALMPPMMAAEEIAHLALFLLSDESKQINGALIPVDGGLRTL
jgi:NAD(P)-dependent dehydrogenase (short-subunit alcohol dehydrogenase family)